MHSKKPIFSLCLARLKAMHGNRLRQSIGTATTTYSYAAGGNRLASITAAESQPSSARMPVMAEES
jgi:hypothetical protein